MKQIKHEGLHLHRLKPEAGNPREQIYAKKWAEVNKIQHGRSAPTLAYLLSDGRTADPFSPFAGKSLLPYDQTAATVAATIIQWLGSNVGFSFVEECLSEAGYRVVPKGDGKRL